MYKKLITLFALVLFAFAMIAVAGEEMTEKKDAPAMKGEHSTFTGKLVCLGCSLRTTANARSECKTFGHEHAIMTEDGKYISLLENKYSADLISGEKYGNKDISVHGIYFASANQLDVEGFTVDGKEKSWCGNCSAMDGCMVSK